MRHYIGTFALFLLLSASLGCQRLMESDFPDSVDERPQMTVSATIEGGNGTRTVLGNPGNGLYRPYWKDSDEIAIYTEGTKRVERFVLQSGAGTGEATFRGPQSSGFMVGLYPYSSITDEGISNNVLTLELPAVQHYAKDSFGDGAYPMLAASYSSELVFKNLCALLQLSITGSDAIEAITFRAHDPAMSVSGKATVRTIYDYVPEMVMKTGGSPEVTLQCGGVDLDPNTPTLFFLAIPAGTYKDGFEVEIISKSGKMIRSTQNDVTFSRTQYRKIHTFAFAPEAEPLAVPEQVDLGLPSGLKWASFNLGANRPEGYGDYFAWGETEPYYISLDPLIWKSGKEAGYDFPSYKWCMGDEHSLTKYCSISDYGYNGFVDQKTVLELEDDAAHIILGDKWRIPTGEEMQELFECCTWEETFQNGVCGRKVTGPNGNSIFLPAAGRWAYTYINSPGTDGTYWTSSLWNYPNQAKQLIFWPDNIRFSSNGRHSGFSIRPVYDDSSATTIETYIPTNIGPCSAEIPFTISTNEVVNNFGIIYSTNINNPVAGNYGEGSYLAYFSSEIGNSMIINELKPNTTYYARAFVTLDEEYGTKIYGNTIQFTTKELSYKSEYVDLGLSVAWATCNLGSSTPSDVGGYYGWGETAPTSLRTAGYKWSGPDGFTKYNATDGKVTLEASDDAASVILGGKWRMPTNDELTELRNNCTWTPATRDGVKGCSVTGPNGKSIFIPISKGTAGSFYAEFLSSSLSTYSNDAYNYVHALTFSYENNYTNFLRTFRDWGTPIRPVYDDSETNPEISVPEPIDLGLSVKWSSFNLGARKPEGYGDYFAWGETQPKERYYLYNYLWYSNNNYTKYNWRSDYGVVDNKIFLDVEDDAAHYYLGGDWRMPTQEEMMELMHYCDWTYFENYQDSGISGCVVRGKKEGYTDNFIFIPTGVYQSSALQFSERIIQGPYAQHGICVGSDNFEEYNKYMVSSTLYRADGWMIRPVSGPRSSYSVLPVNVEFGEVPIGTTAQEPVIITNTGELPVEMRIIIKAPFSADVSSISLNKGESMTIMVSFTPSEAVEYKGISYVSFMSMPLDSWINLYGTGK